MFKDRLKADLDKLSPTNETKSAILENLNKAPSKKAKILSFKATSVIAASLAIVIALGVVINEQFNKSSFANTIFSSAFVSSAKCDRIVKKVNKLSKDFSDNSTFYYSSEGSGSYEHSYLSETPKIKDKLETRPATDYVTDEKIPEYSETNKQVKEVDEDDIIKTDGKYIYRLRYKTRIIIYKADGENTTNVTSVIMTADNDKKEADFNIESFYLYKNHIVVISSLTREYELSECDCYYCQQENIKKFTRISVYNIEDIENPQLEKTFEQSGGYDSSRVIDNVLYLNSNYGVKPYSEVTKNETDRYMPLLCIDGETKTQSDKNVYLCKNVTSAKYSVLCSYNLDNNSRVDDISFFGDSEMTYVSENNIYFTDNGDYDNTVITRVSIDNGKMEKEAETKVNGYINDQFSLDEYSGYLRMVTTIEKKQTTNSLYIFDMNLKLVSSIEKLAKGEYVESVRFLGNYGYFVTFEQVDPLFCVDLSNSENPKIVSELKIPGFSEYLHPFGENKLLGFGQNTTLKGWANGLKLSMFDISDPGNVKEEQVTKIKGDYADYSTNHKAVVVSDTKNLIAFATESENAHEEYVCSYYYTYYYHIYSYDEKNGFAEKFKLKIGETDECDIYYDYDNYSNIRGLYIGDYFYISTNETLTVIDLNTFKTVKTI